MSQRRASLAWSYYFPVAVIAVIAIGAGIAGSWVFFGVLVVLLVAAGVGGYAIRLARQQREDI
jgi:hypothetical protein